MLRVSVAVGRSVGRGGGDRYDMHAASEEEEEEEEGEDSAPVQSDKEENEGGREGGSALSVGPQPRI